MALDPTAHLLMIRQATTTVIDMTTMNGGDPRDRITVLRDAMTRLDAERDRLRAQQKQAVIDAVEAGITNESELARLTGVTRLTIRAWLGKTT